MNTKHSHNTPDLYCRYPPNSWSLGHCTRFLRSLQPTEAVTLARNKSISRSLIHYVKWKSLIGFLLSSECIEFSSGAS